MALFSKKSEDKKEEVVAKTTKEASLGERTLGGIIKAPRITEKATFSADKNVYVFDVDTKSTKHDVALAIKETYKVTPVKIRVTKVPSKTAFIRGKWGTKKGGKKAYVYVDKKEKIEIV